nr:hypothetical protein [Tanacetum cinerariifolium]
MEFHERAFLAKSKKLFKKGTQNFSGAKATDKTECYKYGRTGALTSKSTHVRNQGLIAKAYEWDEEEVSLNNNEMVKVKVLMVLADDESGVVGKETAKNGEWVKISIRKCNIMKPIWDETRAVIRNKARLVAQGYLCQANPKKTHLIDVKRIFRYLKGTHSLGYWYPICLSFDLKGYSNSDYDGHGQEKHFRLGIASILKQLALLERVVFQLVAVVDSLDHTMFRGKDRVLKNFPKLKQIDLKEKSGKKFLIKALSQDVVEKFYKDKTTHQTEGEQRKDKGKKVMSHEDIVVDKESNSDSDAKSRPSDTLEESSKSKPLKKSTHITKFGEKHQMTKEEIKKQKGYSKEYVKKLEIDVHVDLKGILDKLAKLQTSSALTTRFTSLEGFKLDIPVDLLALPSSFINHSSQMEKLKVLDVISDIMGKVAAALDRTAACWNIIYTQMRKNIDDINKIVEKVELDHNRPLEKQDPIIKLNMLARRKRKNMDDLHDYFKQDFISINDFGELKNYMLYNVQEIFFRLHLGPGMDNLARTFKSLLVAEVDKRNLNPNKQMRLIEKLRQ